MKTPKRDIRAKVQLVLSEEEELAIVQKANYYGISKSAYIKMIIMQHARSNVEELGALK